ncbi:MAG TPA: 3-oxoacyl-ACP reductase FabG [Nitrospinota bacterium]|nr:3-oxoacyl-ACP reductase FabG [Nitrospinota bacterium]
MGREFEGQVAVVTGGTGGIGRAICESLLDNGAFVVAIYSRNDQQAMNMISENSRLGDRLKMAKVDVSNYSACEEFFNSLHEEKEKLDILVNSAGIRRDSIVGMMKEEYWRTVLDINLTGTFNMSKLAVRMMMSKRYGRIINVTSPIGRIGFAGQANYAASKAGQVAMAKSLAKEVATRKITVNCVSPGFINTGFISDLPKEQLKEFKKQVPMGRFGTTVEVASAVKFLASTEAAYITGAVLEVSGGI